MHAMPLLREVVIEHLTKVRLVLDDQHAGHGMALRFKTFCGRRVNDPVTVE